MFGSSNLFGRNSTGCCRSMGRSTSTLKSWSTRESSPIIGNQCWFGRCNHMDHRLFLQGICVMFIRYNRLIPFVQSVSQTLHTCTPSIFTILLNYFLSNATNLQSTQTLLRRSLTALIHHVGNADQFSILSETILQQVLLIFKQANYDVKQLGRALDVCSILLGVRQGSRLTGPQPR